MNNVQDAQRVLRHYFRLSASKSGWTWDSDSDGEIDAVIDGLMCEVDARIAAALRPLLAQPDAMALDAKLQRAELRAADMADTVAAQAATIAKLTAERDDARRACDLLLRTWAGLTD
jgi:hypothetical protein